MTRSSITKKALFISTCALLFSMLMMAGSTFAWFTDSVSTGSNKIKTGSLKVELLHTNAKVTKEEAVTQNTLLFTDDDGEAISWEPGAVAYENFTVKNAWRSGAELQARARSEQCEYYQRDEQVAEGCAEGQGFTSGSDCFRCDGRQSQE